MKNVPAQINYFETFAAAVDAVQLRLDDAQIELVFGTITTPADDHWSQQIFRKGPLSYGQSLRASFEILTKKGKPTRSWFHVQIWRLDSGTYELNTYAL